MTIERMKGIIEAILFASGDEVKLKDLSSVLGISDSDVISIIENMQAEYKENDRGITIVKLENSYQLSSKKEYHEYIYPIIDKRAKPNLSPSTLEVLAIIAYNPKVTRAEIEAIRGVNSDASIYRLLEYNLIQECGRLDAPGRPTIYETSSEFLRMFGYRSLDELPELPRYRLDENEQIVLDDIENEAPCPERDEK